MSKFNRRQVTALLGGGLLAPLAAPSIVKAQSQAIFIVVPYASGGTIDNMIRTIAKSMSETLQRPVLVDNKPGGNGIVGSQYVARAPKDGTVLLAGGTGPISLNVMLRKNLPYKLEDFASVAMLCTGPLTLTVNAEKMPANDVKSFVAHAKSRTQTAVLRNTGPGQRHAPLRDRHVAIDGLRGHRHCLSQQPGIDHGLAVRRVRPELRDAGRRDRASEGRQAENSGACPRRSALRTCPTSRLSPSPAIRN